MLLKELDYSSYNLEEVISADVYKASCYISLGLRNVKFQEVIKKLSYFERVFFKYNQISALSQTDDYSITTVRGNGRVVAKDFLMNFFRKIPSVIEVEGHQILVTVVKMKNFAQISYVRIQFYSDALIENLGEKGFAIVKRVLEGEMVSFFEELNAIIRGEQPILQYETYVEDLISTQAYVYIDRIDYSVLFKNDVVQNALSECFANHFEVIEEKDSLRSLSRKFDTLNPDGFFASIVKRIRQVKEI